LKVLIADDNKNVRELIKKILLNAQMKVELLEAIDGEDAISIFQKKRPDLVLMDIVMTPIDGLVATRKIISMNPQAKIIIVSQYPEEEYKREAFACGAIEYFNKENLSAIPSIIKKYIQTQ